MAQFCQHSESSPEGRLGNPLSDDSLLLEDGLPSSVWADSENEPTFCVAINQTSSSTPQRLQPELGSTAEWKIDKWKGWNQLNHTADRTNNGVYNVPMRYAISSEDADTPLLANEGPVNSELNQEVVHCHSLIPPPQDGTAWRRLLTATIMCLVFMVIEIVGGHIAGSTAVMTDAAHLLSDFVGLLVSLSAVWLGQRPPTKTLSMGFHRAEVLGALFSITVIWVLTGIFVYVGIIRLLQQDFTIYPDKMIAVASIAVIINILMGLILHGAFPNIKIPHSHFSGKHHHHHHFPEAVDSHDEEDNSANLTQTALAGNENNRGLLWTCNGAYRQTLSPPRTGEQGQKKSSFGTPTNINVRAAAIHVLGDLIQSIGVLVSAIIIKFIPGAKIVDPICTFLFSIIVFVTTVPLLRDTGLVLLEAFPRGINYDNVLSALRAVPGVMHAHSLHVWSLSLGKHALSVHLAIDPTTDRDTVVTRARKAVQHTFGILHCTIQTEVFHQNIMNSCVHCQPPSCS